MNPRFVTTRVQSGGRSSHTKGFRLRIKLLLARIGCGWVLWSLRRRTGLSRVEASRRIGVSPRRLLRFELGLSSPPLAMLAALLTVYRADDDALMFFSSLSAFRDRTILHFLARASVVAIGVSILPWGPR